MIYRHTDRHSTISFFFFFNDTATTEIYTLSLHDALPISTSLIFKNSIKSVDRGSQDILAQKAKDVENVLQVKADRKSTRLNSSHVEISYAVFCLKKKNN